MYKPIQIYRSAATHILRLKEAATAHTNNLADLVNPFTQNNGMQLAYAQTGRSSPKYTIVPSNNSIDQFLTYNSGRGNRKRTGKGGGNLHPSSETLNTPKGIVYFKNRRKGESKTEYLQRTLKISRNLATKYMKGKGQKKGR